jgi:hypothetical protein
MSVKMGLSPSAISLFHSKTHTDVLSQQTAQFPIRFVALFAINGQTDLEFGTPYHSLSVIAYPR